MINNDQSTLLLYCCEDVKSHRSGGDTVHLKVHEDIGFHYTAKNAKIGTSLLTTCNNLSQQTDITMRSHRLRQLVTTTLLQVVNRLVSKLIISTGLLQVLSTSCNKSANDKLQQA